jgi:ubiquitin C-terminal hydrolase
VKWPGTPMIPEEDYSSWQSVFLSSIEPTGSYLYFLDDCIRLFNHYSVHNSLPSPIESSTAQFIGKLVPAAINAILSLHYLYPAESENVSAFLVRMCEHVIRCFCGDIEPYADVLSHIYNRDEHFYRLNNASTQVVGSMTVWVAPSYLEIVRHFPGDAYFGRILSRLTDVDRPANLGHWIAVIRIVTCMSRVVEPADSSAIVTKLAGPLRSFVQGIDRTNLRGLDSNSLVIVLKGAVTLAMRAIQSPRDLLTEVLDFSFFCCKSQFLDKQLMGTDVLFNAAMVHTDDGTFKNWAIANDIFKFVVEKDLHEQMLLKFSKFIRSLLVDVPVTPEQLMQLWNRLQHSHVSQRKALTDLLSEVFIVLDQEAALGFVHGIISVGSPAAESLTFLGGLAFSVLHRQSEVAREIVRVILEFYDNPETAAVAQPSVANLCERSSSVLNPALMNYFREKLKEETVNPVTIGLMKTLIDSSYYTSQDVLLCNIDTFVNAVCSHRTDSELLLDLLQTYLIKAREKLSVEHVQRILPFVTQSGRGWTLLHQILKKKAGGIFTPESLAEMWRQLNEFPVGEVTECMIRFVNSLITVSGLLEATVSGQMARGRHRPFTSLLPQEFSFTTFRLTGFDLLVRLYLESNEAEICLRHILGIFMKIQTAARGELPGYLIQLFEKASTVSQRDRVILLICHSITDVFEKFLDSEDYGYLRHKKPSKANQMKITVQVKGWATTGPSRRPSYEVTVPNDADISCLVNAIAMKIGIDNDGFWIIGKDPQLFFDPQASLAEADVHDGSVLSVAFGSRGGVEPRFPITVLLSYHLTSANFQKVLICILSHPVDPGYAKNVWKLLKLLSTDTEFTEKVTNVSEVESPYLILYRVEIWEKIKSFDHASELINLVLTRKLPSFCAGGCLRYLANCEILSAFAVLDRFVPFLLEFLTHDTSQKKWEAAFTLLMACFREHQSQATRVALEHPAELRDLLFIRPSRLISSLPRLFSLFDQKSKVFDLFVGLFDKAANDPIYFSILGAVIDRSCDVRPIFGKCARYFDEHMEHLPVPICDFIAVVLKSDPDLIDENNGLFVTFLNLTLTQSNESFLESIYRVCSIICEARPEEEREISQVFLKVFDFHTDRWSYLPSQNAKSSTNYAGLKNLGSTCYMNSVLQLLFFNRDFLAGYLSSAPDGDWYQELRIVFSKLELTDLAFVDTRPLCSVLRFPGPAPVSVREQQDACEFLQFLLDKMPPSLQELYRCQTTNRIEALDGSFHTENIETSFSISIPVKDIRLFDESMSSLLQEELFTGENQYFSEDLGKKVDARKYSKVHSVGPYLVIQLKRFEYDLRTWARSKVNDQFTFPFHFDIAPYLDHESAEQDYSLIGVVIHSGTADGGHYYSFAHRGNHWFCLNDTDVTACSREKVRNDGYGRAVQYGFDDDIHLVSSGYLLFYVRSNFVSQSVVTIDPGIRQLIDVENQKHQQMQSYFSEATALFVTKHSTDIVVLWTYLVNIFGHSNHIGISEILLGNVNRPILAKPNESITFVTQHVAGLIDIFANCAEQQIVAVHAQLLWDLFRVASAELSAELVTKVLDKLDVTLTIWRQIPFFSLLPWLFCRSAPGDPMEYAVRWCDPIMGFILRLYQTQPSPVMLENVDLGKFFDFLKTVSPERLTDLLPLSHLIMLSQFHAQYYIEWVLSFDDRNPRFMEDFLRVLIENRQIPQLRMNFLTYGLLTCESDADVKLILNISQTRLQLPQSQIATIILERIQAGDTDLAGLVVTHVNQLFFYLIIAENADASNAMEAIASHLFRSFPALPRFNTSESLLDNLYSMRTVSISSFGDLADPQEDSPAPDEKEIKEFQRFFDDLFASLRRITPLKSYRSPDVFSRLTRVFHWIVLRIQPCTINHLNVFFEFLKQSQASVPSPNCTSIEMLRLFGSLQEPLKTNFLTSRSQDFLDIIFPIDFREYPRFSRSLVLRFFSVFRNVIVLEELFEVPSVAASIKKFFKAINDSGARRFVKYLSVRLTRASEKRLLSFVIQQLKENSAESANLILISAILPRLTDSLDDDVFTFIIEYLVAEIESHAKDHDFVARVRAACASLIDLSGRWKLSRTDVFKRKLPSLVRFIATTGVGHHGQFAIREGLRNFLHRFASLDISLNLAILDAIARCLEEEPDVTNQAFWSLQHLFCSCLVLVADQETRMEGINREFSRMLDFLDSGAYSDFEKCFSFLIQLIKMDGYRLHEAWASVMYCLLMASALLLEGVKGFLMVIIENETDDWVVENFMQYMAELKNKDPAEFDETIERAALFLQAKPELRTELLQLVHIEPETFDNWPRQHIALLPLFQAPADLEQKS